MDSIDCTFSLLNQGRVYTGNHRKYIIENAREVCYAPATRERIKLREAFGYYGHGRRQLARKMDINEIELVPLPGGAQIISNIPSNVTVKFDIAEDGTVTHTQDILHSETGNIVQGLHASRVGGFSWACPGSDRATGTRLTGFAGFDYVLQPGFSANRGYVLESAGSAPMEQMILESVAAIVGDDARAEQYVKGWLHDAENRLNILENAAFEAEAQTVELLAEAQRNEQAIATLDAEKRKFEEALANERNDFTDMIASLAKSFPCFIPERALHDMLNGDFTRAKGIFEQARLIDFTQYPLVPPSQEQHPKTCEGAQTLRQPEYGTAEYGLGMFTDLRRD